MEKRDFYENNSLENRSYAEEFDIDDQDQVIEKEEAASNLLTELEKINFSKMEDLMDWFCEFQKVASYAPYDLEEVLWRFEQAWFYPRPIKPKNFSKDNPIEFSKQIIWQALYDIERYWIVNDFIQKYVNNWKSLHWEKAQEDRDRLENLKNTL